MKTTLLTNTLVAVGMELSLSLGLGHVHISGIKEEGPLKALV